MDTSLPTDAKTPASCINEVLDTYSARNANTYVHPKVLSFVDGKDRRNWAGSVPDADCRAVVSNFIKAPKPDGNDGSKRYWIALLSAPHTGKYKDGKIGSYVGRDKDKLPWHCSVVAVFKHENGYSLIVYDPDPNPMATQTNSRIKVVLRGLQRSIYVQLRQKSEDIRVWYRTREDRKSKGQCLRHAMELLRQLVEIGGGEWDGDDDPRVEGCVRLTRK
ncbi:uncharacterized protein B0J16DRAFT_393253 [Fusarium flagelliforme]|uniref:uncharacterized protein n=1 Tax=Fusarium flagelliforme TaxID=2675880 RepID=UPI001E8CE409|nr:uncharacterized protein B0J16DRAFT_393253 [Fusarium flagelliforme]KAH7199113.1 hypothetical protein B0J16DRAFT_393253 [Fusarium flagelliforme]